MASLARFSRIELVMKIYQNVNTIYYKHNIHSSLMIVEMALGEYEFAYARH